MRLFLALVPPPEVLDEIDRVLEPHRPGWPKLRWLPRANWHITLTFLGEVDEACVDRLIPRLDRAARRHPPFPLSFGGAGTFPRHTRARVLWADLRGDRRALERLAAATTAAARRAGVPPDRHKRFSPHLSLARSKAPADLRALVASLAPFEGSTWTADTIHLVRSHLGRAVRYETLTTWSMGPGEGERGGRTA